MEKYWKIPGPCDNIRLREQLKVDRIVADLLTHRRILTYDEARTFFRPQLDQLHDPFLMRDMQQAVERISRAIKNDERILVYGDYDVDGTTAVSLVYSFFSKHTTHIGFYIPDRYKEGYGISFQGIDFAAQNGYTLIIALDCGIKAIDKVDYANEKKIDFIICDHHLPGEVLPRAAAVLDPKRTDCDYPYKELSGAGIGFKLIQAYAQFCDLPAETCYDYLDLVTVSIAADIVPITGENRVLAHSGLEKINTDPRPGIKAILNINTLKSAVNINTLVFTVGPRINAAGRIEHGSKAVALLNCDSYDLAATHASAINDTNTQRRDLDLGITTEAFEILDNDLLTGDKRTTVLFNEKWHKGVIGIVASRLIEKYYRPTIILTESEGKVTGSARSVREFDVYSAIEKCSELLDQFGGHKFAAGLSLKKENVQAFKDKFEAVVSATITPDQLTPKIAVDAEIEFHEITDKLLRILKQFAPHGPENMTPVFCGRNVYDTGWGQVFGNNHLKLELFQKSNPNIRFQAIAFDKGDYINFFQRKIPMDIVFKIQENEFRNGTAIQVIIEDLRVASA